MSEEKKPEDYAVGSTDASAEESRKGGSSASRARNRTVMLTPEMTGHVRALLQDASETEVETGEHIGSESLEDYLPPLTDWEASQQATPDEHQQPTGGGLRSEHPGLFGLGRTSGSFGQVEPEKRASLTDTGGERSGFDPLTSLVSQPTATRRTAQFGTPAQNESRQLPPSFSVNSPNQAPQANAPASFSGKAPRTAAPVASSIATMVSPTTKNSKVVGFLISYDNDPHGEVYEVRVGRWLITSRPTDHGDYILINDDTISPLHAILKATKQGEIQVLDQLSENGTAIKRRDDESEIEVSGGLESVSHGDLVRFGQRYFVVCCIPKIEIEVKTEEVSE